MTKSEFEALPTAGAMLDVLHESPDLWNDKEFCRIFCAKAEEEDIKNTIELFGSYDPDVCYDYNKRKRD